MGSGGKPRTKALLTQSINKRKIFRLFMYGATKSRASRWFLQLSCLEWQFSHLRETLLCFTSLRRLQATWRIWHPFQLHIPLMLHFICDTYIQFLSAWNGKSVPAQLGGHIAMTFAYNYTNKEFIKSLEVTHLCIVYTNDHFCLHEMCPTI